MANIKKKYKLDDLPRGYHPNIMDEINSQTGRGVAVVGASYVDLVLREAIATRFCQPDMIERLLGQSGPIRDFGVRIDLGYALGLYGGRAHNDLKIVQDIRNAFAHSADAIDFDREDVTRRCNELWFPKKILYGKTPMPTMGRELFIRAIQLLSDGLHENVARAKNGIAPSSFLMMGPAIKPSVKGGKAKP